MTPTIPVFAESTRKRARIEIIPLIDVVFFLLATFVLFTLALEKIRSHEITFPVARVIISPNPLDETLYLTSSGPDMYLWKVGQTTDAEALYANELPGRLTVYAASAKKPRVMLNGDGDAKFSASIRAIDAIKRAGIADFTFDTSGR